MQNRLLSHNHQNVGKHEATKKLQKAGWLQWRNRTGNESFHSLAVGPIAESDCEQILNPHQAGWINFSLLHHSEENGPHLKQKEWNPARTSTNFHTSIGTENERQDMKTFSDQNFPCKFLILIGSKIVTWSVFTSRRSFLLRKVLRKPVTSETENLPPF